MIPTLVNVPTGANGTGTVLDTTGDPTFPNSGGVVALVDGTGTWTVTIQYLLPGSGSVWVPTTAVAVSGQAAGVGAVVALPNGRKFRVVVSGWSSGQARVQIGDPTNPNWT